MKCRTCEIILELTGKIGIHNIEDVNLYCPLCQYVGNSIVHSPQIAWQDTMIECQGCNNYILYHEKGHIWKDESYFSEIELQIIRRFANPISYKSNFNSITNSKSYIQHGKLLADKQLIELNGMIELTTSTEMVKRLKTLIVFS
jgi:hypothetical protein